MEKPFEIEENGKARIVVAVICDDWRVLMVKHPQTGVYYAAGIKLGR
ncbi:hypothetical protein [Pseudomonas veronii]|jgi:hypothetical protein|nr:hypothetical protein [Pseudomonas veronii]